ncbi:MAG: hypothetical protein HW421_475 [Ignavibacteria bacterium]|nr:hypothetical protein [Ignavibacteria bacterium]
MLNEKLIAIEKKVFEGDFIYHYYKEVLQTFPMNLSIDLFSEKPPFNKFRMEIYQKNKKKLEMKLSLMINGSSSELLKFKLGDKYTNPYARSDFPENISKYAGITFKSNEPRIYAGLDGSVSLDFAVPFSCYDFPLKSIKNNDDIILAIIHFWKTSNIVTELKITPFLIF